MGFVLHHVLGFQNDALDRETATAILEEAAKLATGVLAPLNWGGDQSGTKLKDGTVTTAPGFKEAYKNYCDGGWNSVPFSPDFGGQGLPWAIAFPVQEMWQSANMSFGLCPLLNQGAIDAISAHGSEEQKQFYLPRMISGAWTGTMNLTEPQAGSDLGLLRAKAEKQADGAYKIFGQKIFITYGEHDFTDNIIHLVLARTTDAPEDVKGISLFIVPKFLEDGTRNDVVCTGIEHKLGIHASPTCTMQFGDQGGAVGYLVGQEHQGLKYMFTMMNNARLSVGLQGVAIAERAYQRAKTYAHDRMQGKSFTGQQRVSIDQHADVRRMLLTMQSYTEAGRLLAYQAALALDKAHEGDKAAQAQVDVMTPIVKSWCTDMACEVASIGVQVHGGMGFVEETGAAQYYRDARILPIYEGTNGIQAADLVFRKILRDEGVSARAYINALQTKISPSHGAQFSPLIQQLLTVTDWLIAAANKDNGMDMVAAASAPYLKAFGMIAGGVMLSLSYDRAADVSDQAFVENKQRTAQFFITNILPLAGAHLTIAHQGAQHV
jgi:alkylation response protein AidB-like acyl-CoA dehydrogenase